MNSILIREMFKDDGDMITVAAVAYKIEKETWATRKTCNWLDAVPQALEKETLFRIRSILQRLHPQACGSIRGIKEQEILLAYWRLLARDKKKRFLEFLYELNLELVC